MPRRSLIALAILASPGLASAGVLDVSGSLDGGATSGEDDQLVYSNLRVGYVLFPHFTIALTSRTGAASAGDRWLGALAGTAELWQDFGRLRASLRLGGVHQHEAPREALEERPLSVTGGIDDEITHRTGGLGGISLTVDLLRAERGVVYGGVGFETLAMVDGGGPRWYLAGGLSLGFRVELSPATPDRKFR
jgi:hypothetical protein